VKARDDVGFLGTGTTDEDIAFRKAAVAQLVGHRQRGGRDGPGRIGTVDFNELLVDVARELLVRSELSCGVARVRRLRDNWADEDKNGEQCSNATYHAGTITPTAAESIGERAGGSLP
jgi:hypothetical protein